jgi:hypothetical protein
MPFFDDLATARNALIRAEAAGHVGLAEAFRMIAEQIEGAFGGSGDGQPDAFRGQDRGRSDDSTNSTG